MGVQSTYNTLLKVKNKQGVIEKLVDIIDYPDLIGTPETIDVTTLSDKSQMNIFGIQQQDSLSFSANYTASDYARVRQYADYQEHDFELWFGNDGNGEDGIFAWSGQLSVSPVGGGVNEAKKFTISISTTSTPDIKQAVAYGVSVEKNGTKLVATVGKYPSTASIGTIAYAWEKDGAPVSGSTNELNNSTAGTYKCKATVTTTEDVIGGVFVSNEVVVQ